MIKTILSCKIVNKRMEPEPRKLLHDRVEFKLYSASYHLNKIKELKENHAGIHDDLSSVHLEIEIDCFLSQIYGSIDALLVLINNKLKLGLPINDVNKVSIKKELQKIGRSDLLLDLEMASCQGNWLAELSEFRNQTTHRERLRRMREYDPFNNQSIEYISTKQRKISLNPSDYMTKNLVRYFEESLERVQELIITVRMKDPALRPT